MKNLFKLLFTALPGILLTLSLNAQITINSTDGYSVTVSAVPQNIVTYSSSCQWGYSWNVNMSYKIAFAGTNAPASMYTLNGTVGCGSNNMWFELPDGPSQGTAVTTSTPWNSASNCTTASIANMSCKDVFITIEGRGISSRTVQVPVAVVLPVKMADFNVTLERNGVNLRWSTASEDNNDYFTVERSANGDNWNKVGTVRGAGNSANYLSYAYNDAKPLPGTSYYRIRQTDLDGNSSVSDTRTVKNAGIRTSIAIYPIPNSGNNITLSGITEYSANTLEVLNAAGDNVFKIMLRNGSVELPKLATGFYFIRITNQANGEVSNIRYIKN